VAAAATDQPFFTSTTHLTTIIQNINIIQMKTPVQEGRNEFIWFPNKVYNCIQYHVIYQNNINSTIKVDMNYCSWNFNTRNSLHKLNLHKDGANWIFQILNPNSQHSGSQVKWLCSSTHSSQNAAESCHFCYVN